MVKSAGSNKLYHCPQSPEPERLFKREKSFILDCVAVNTISKDYSNCNPKLGTIIPPYNGQKDPNAAPYFRIQGVHSLLHRTGQDPPGTPIEGIVEELFFTKGSGFRYLSRRNEWGCGRSHEVMSGHAGMFSPIRPITGYNGEGGYRRNTPSLRRYPSCFGPPVFYLPQIVPLSSARKSSRNTGNRESPEKPTARSSEPAPTKSQAPAEETTTPRSRRQSRHSVSNSAKASPTSEQDDEPGQKKPRGFGI